MSIHKDKNAVIGLGALVVIIILVLWWMSSGLPSATSTDMSTSTSPTTTPVVKTVQPSTKPKVVDSTVNGVIANLANASRFAALYTSTGVSAQVKGAGPYTVFVPTNEAYGAVGGAISAMSAAQKTRLVRYHVIMDRAMDPAALVSGNVQTLSRDYLNFSISSAGNALINSSTVVSSYKATNGIVYVISAVLLPPKY